MKSLETSVLELPSHQEQWSMLREEILEEVESLDEDLDTYSITSFLESLGFENQTILFVDLHGIEKINQKFKKFNFELTVSPSNAGMYFSDLSFGIVNRSLTDEYEVLFADSNPSKLIESFAVHESIHGTTSHTCTLDLRYKTASGFIEKKFYWGRNW